MDETDKKILQQLQRNSKLTTKALAADLGLSATAVYERIRRLERNGMILGYVARIDPVKVHLDFRVFCQVKLSQHVQHQIRTFEKEVDQLKEVVSCYHLGGEYDYLLEICVRDMAAYREFMVSKLTLIPQIGSTHSAFVINTVKQTHELPL
ncbi:Lrp/AsnC family transcriptional regulator [Robiginitalea aurantiaca]|uniref:Lrp/AsnC family transcriptional regulator n=1 Tax=Robiginitalea aurantiaca TaxID=3056915 RepID=A0ABT7WGU4_9FLAO|nr:Lrp/AsnC family transcriptional regulator [Robiginitalea aurantiaca]MDM9632141.1 Lrp/AsnC family transcriptional regulator [Robiginitalea aurantiaca]